MSQSGLVTEEQSAESCGNATAAISGGWAASREGQPQPALPQVRCQGTRPPAAIRLVKVLQRCVVTGQEETGQLQTLHAQKLGKRKPSLASCYCHKETSGQQPHTSLLPSLPPSPHSARSASSPAGQCSAQPFELLYIQRSSKAAICRKLMSCKQRCSAASLQ